MTSQQVCLFNSCSFSLKGDHSGFSTDITWDLSTFRAIYDPVYVLEGASEFEHKGVLKDSKVFDEYLYGTPRHLDLLVQSVTPHFISSSTNRPKFLWNFRLPQAAFAFSGSDIFVIIEVSAFQDIGDEEFVFNGLWAVTPSFYTLFEHYSLIFHDVTVSSHYAKIRSCYHGRMYQNITNNSVSVVLDTQMNPGKTSEDESLTFGAHFSFNIITDLTMAMVEGSASVDSSVQVEMDPLFELLG